MRSAVAGSVAPRLPGANGGQGFGALTGTGLSLALASKLVAWNTAVPIMVATETLNGAIRRVPSMGTSHTNMSLLSIRYCTV